MRSVNQFTDGRIHVTLFEGAYDLAAMDAADRTLYEKLTALYSAGISLADFEMLADPSLSPFAMTARLRYRQPLASIFSDMCCRLALYEHGWADRTEELVPWRPEESRRLFESWLGYRPALSAQLAA